MCEKLRVSLLSGVMILHDPLGIRSKSSEHGSKMKKNPPSRQTAGASGAQLSQSMPPRYALGETPMTSRNALANLLPLSYPN